MSTSTLPAKRAAEFTLPERYQTSHRAPLPWLVSRLLHYWPIVLLVLFGALTNGALAAFVPIVIGDAFEAILQSPPRTDMLMGFVWILLISQTIRSVLQFARNFGAEWLGQLFERDIREELYISLLGKSMTFHSLQSVGDTMARATNDVREINLMFNPGLNLVVGASFFLVTPIVASYAILPELAIIPVLFTLSYFLSIWHYLRWFELAPFRSVGRC
jgi:ATP-binding cassette subfamily B protein